LISYYPHDHRNTAAKVAAELNIHLEDPISTKTVQQELHKYDIYGRAAIAEPVITENNTKRWCDDHRTWISDDCKHAVWSNELSFTLFPTSGFVGVWRTSKKACKPECLVPTVKHGDGSVMIWASVYWYSASPIIALNGRIMLVTMLTLGN
jgi:hypothetical protein